MADMLPSRGFLAKLETRMYTESNMYRKQIRNGRINKSGRLSQRNGRSTRPGARDARSAFIKLRDALASEEVLMLNPAKIRSYLRAHTVLGKILPSVCARARQELGKESELSLFLYQDPEINDCHLSLNVRLPSYDKNVTKQLDRVTEPFEEDLCNASGYLLVTTDFRIARAKNGI